MMQEVSFEKFTSSSPAGKKGSSASRSSWMWFTWGFAFVCVIGLWAMRFLPEGGFHTTPISYPDETEFEARAEVQVADAKTVQKFAEDEKEVEVENKEYYEHKAKERPIKLAFFHDPNTDYGMIGSYLLVNSIMKYTSEPEHIMFHIIIESPDTYNSTVAFVEKMKKSFPQLVQGTGGAAIHVQKESPDFNKLFKRVQWRSALCRRKKVLMHHFCLPDTMPVGVGKIIMLDTDMMLREDITILWDLVARQLDDEHVVAAHKNCLQPYARYFKRIGLSKHLIPDREFAIEKGQCSYDNGLTALNMDSPKVRNMLKDTLEMVMDDRVFWNMRYVACTRDMMNLLFAKNYGTEGIPSEW
eukprot:CAMPEP_0204834538 /NCGR_PEP_ID=MMETSP1346-20131115/20038_1 /ASSEMBLY_ACC=CAM_ASM_000771 /TAXON_ID=215587 /ORGANISM="Aplanochytrium stocchinoi, Strain GSBS06" /LENGTH=355 /DNA_ID=CAMNT_0051967905 /DNA_START=337 /DNA_END=1401 /DNA_ORIENTATION=-